MNTDFTIVVNKEHEMAYKALDPEGKMSKKIMINGEERMIVSYMMPVPEVVKRRNQEDYMKWISEIYPDWESQPKWTRGVYYADGTKKETELMPHQNMEINKHRRFV